MASPTARAVRSDSYAEFRGLMLRRLTPKQRQAWRRTAIDGHIWDWLRWLSSCGRADGTLDAYTRDLRDFAQWLQLEAGLDSHVGDLSAGRIQQYQAYLGRRLSRASVARKLDALSSFFKFLVRAEVTERNPVDSVPRPRPKSNRARFMPKEEATKVLAALETPLERAIFMVAYQVGLRRGELKSVRVKDLDLGRQRLRVCSSKTDSTRVVPIPNQLAACLRDYLATRPECRHEELFITERGKPLCNSTLNRWFRRWMQQAGLEDGGYRLHDLRHSAATNLIGAGYDVPEVRDILGHTSVATTSIYLHSDLEQMQQKMGRVELRKVPNAQSNSAADHSGGANEDDVARQLRLGVAHAIKAGDAATARELTEALGELT